MLFGITLGTECNVPMCSFFIYLYSALYNTYILIWPTIHPVSNNGITTNIQYNIMALTLNESLSQQFQILKLFFFSPVITFIRWLQSDDTIWELNVFKKCLHKVDFNLIIVSQILVQIFSWHSQWYTINVVLLNHCDWIEFWHSDLEAKADVSSTIVLRFAFQNSLVDRCGRGLEIGAHWKVSVAVNVCCK